MKIRDKSQLQKNSQKNSNNSYLNKNQDTINTLCDKFNISIEEANNILIKLENESKIKQTKQPNSTKSLSDIKNYENEVNLSKQKSDKNVDNILSNIIPDYSKKIISIELKNVNLTFELTSDKIDTIKETFIRTLKRNKPKKTKFKVLDNITFKIYKGEKIGIIGYNGAGKSTLLNVISGIYPPDSGIIKTYGKISPLLSLGAGFDYNYSGRKNIYLNGAVLGYDKKFLKEKEHEIIEFSELEEFIDMPIKNYSSGMLAKLGFSIATAVNPDLLIIDEILGVGDITFQRKSSDKIRSLMDGGTTVLLVSHSIPQIRALCDKAIWINKGKIKEIGEVNKVCDNYIKESEKANKKELANIKLK